MVSALAAMVFALTTAGHAWRSRSHKCASAARSSAFVLSRHFAPVVADADEHGEEGRDESDPHVAIRKVGENERWYDDRQVDEDAAHRGCARLHLMAFRPFLADGLADLPHAQPADEGGPEEDREQKRHERRVRRPERDVPEDVEERQPAVQWVEQPEDHRAAVSAFARSSFATRRSSNGSSRPDRKSTRLNSSHLGISYAVFCL